MSYLRAEEVLPKELIETIQQYVNGGMLYIPCTEKQEWGSNTDTKEVLEKRNSLIFAKYCDGAAIQELATEFSLSPKSIQRIIRNRKLIA